MFLCYKANLEVGKKKKINKKERERTEHQHSGFLLFSHCLSQRYRQPIGVICHLVTTPSSAAALETNRALPELLLITGERSLSLSTEK